MAQTDVWLLIGLFAATIPLVALARRVNVPYPVVLVLGGLVLGFIPGLPPIRLNPNLVLVLFLPPLLYWEAITAPTDVMRANAGQIWVLAIGLVLATTAAVAVVSHAVIPNMAWAMAFVLGAIVAPTDELASAPVLERLRMPRHLIAIVEGESLLNDASSLILYAAAVAAAVTGIFSPGRTLAQFVLAGVGGALLGLIAGRLAVEGWRRIRERQLQGVISVSLPYLAYSAAQRFGLSGVLAVVFAGIFVNRYTPIVLTAASRLQLTGYWETVVFLANAILFLLVGLQLNTLSHIVLQEYSWQAVLWYAVAVNVTVIGIRFAWLMLQELVPVIRGASEHPQGDWKHAFVASWSGLRGAVSLAAALAIPTTMAGGVHLAHRNLVIFLTFSVILVTLVGGGLTLPLVIRALRVPEGADEENEEVRHAMVGVAEAALARIAELERDGRIGPSDVQRLRRRYEHRRGHAEGHPPEEQAALDAERDLVGVERRALITMRERGEIDNTVLRRLQRSLDLAEQRLGD
ncbi:MAG: Na+/H+ antiporter [Candidatus Eremiobacteraeota bacterium]|nr:Na+/H+ antiporter [Candidatus Eremiobacteraeota bacterium]